MVGSIGSNHSTPDALSHLHDHDDTHTAKTPTQQSQSVPQQQDEDVTPPQAKSKHVIRRQSSTQTLLNRQNIGRRQSQIAKNNDNSHGDGTSDTANINIPPKAENLNADDTTHVRLPNEAKGDTVHAAIPKKDDDSEQREYEYRKAISDKMVDIVKSSTRMVDAIGELPLLN